MFKGRIFSLTILGGCSLVLAACASQPKTLALSDYGSYRCGQLDIRVAPAEDGQLLGLEYLDRRVLLKPSPTDTGALYVAPGDTSTRFLAEGKRATLTLKGDLLPECLEPGAIESRFEAIGADPDWSALIENNRMTLTPPYQQQALNEIWLTETLANRHGRTFEAKTEAQSLEVRVAHQLCEVGLDKRQYPSQIRLTLDGNSFEGCGGDRERLFRGVQWVVEDLAGAGLIDRSMVTLQFLGNGRVAGRASCNRFMGNYRLSDDGLSFSTLGSTMMACAPSLMNQERKYLELLGQVVDGRIGRQGELLLETGNGEVIKALPATTDNL